MAFSTVLQGQQLHSRPFQAVFTLHAAWLMWITTSLHQPSLFLPSATAGHCFRSGGLSVCASLYQGDQRVPHHTQQHQHHIQHTGEAPGSGSMAAPGDYCDTINGKHGVERRQACSVFCTNRTWGIRMFYIALHHIACAVLRLQLHVLRVSCCVLVCAE